MARKKASEMTASEKLESIKRQEEKLALQKRALNAELACRFLVKAMMQGETNGGSVNWDTVNQAFEYAAQVVDPQEFKEEPKEDDGTGISVFGESSEAEVSTVEDVDAILNEIDL